ncbi:MAG: putative polysaccharide biosynthesis protein [Candidatus Moranbacteria bacterium GW2011_GWA2_39_41]|nr:MAG: putative polysaccharide biosynthesis protein [Candidatus Moranbacteria bacterium GW2011_GWA2_39_41]
MSSNIAKSALWVTVSEILFNLSGFIIHSVLGRVLGPADYGRYGLIVTLTTMVIVLIGNGIPTAMAKYISEIYETNPLGVLQIKKQAIKLQVLIVGAITVIFYFSAGLISKALGDPTLAPLFRFSTLIIPAFAAASFYFSYYTGLHKFNTQATLKTIRSVMRIGFVVGLAFIFGLKGSISGYVIAPFSVFAIAYAIDKFKIAKELKSRIVETQNIASIPETNFDWRKLVNYGWQVVVFFLAYELLISIDLYMVKAILHDDVLTGIYNASLTVGRIPYYIFYAMTVFLLPMMSKSTAQNNHAETARILEQALRIILILLVPMIILLSIFALPTLQLLYGQKYLAGAVPMSILVFGVGFLTLFYVLSFAMNGAGKTKLVMWIASVGLVINSVLNYFFIHKYGILGSAIATSVTSFVIMTIMLYYLKRDFGVTYKMKSILRVTLAGFHVYIFSLIVPLRPKLFFLETILLLGVYFGFLWILREIKKEDLVILQNIIRRKKVAEVEQELSGNEPSA